MKPCVTDYDIVKSAYLIDPVDGDNRFATESDDYPSAVKELAGKGHKIGIVGEYLLIIDKLHSFGDLTGTDIFQLLWMKTTSTGGER